MTRRRRRQMTGQRELSSARRERPGAAIHGPPVTITCACGRRQSARYGDTWTCESCGQTWDTGRIPRGDYDEIRRLQLRFRLVPILLGLLVVGLAALFTVTGSPGAIVLLLPIVLLTWFTFLREAHRRRYRGAIAARRRKWTLKGQA